MQHEPLSSTNLESFGYDPINRTLEVRFKNGNTYQYNDVSPAFADGLRSAPSAGRYFQQEIRNRFHGAKQ